MNTFFRKFAHATSDLVGAPWAFVIGLAVIVGWAVTGPLFNYSDTWQLIINTSTTIVTFLMVFVIQNTRNRDAAAQVGDRGMSVGGRRPGGGEAPR